MTAFSVSTPAAAALAVAPTVERVEDAPPQPAEPRLVDPQAGHRTAPVDPMKTQDEAPTPEVAPQGDAATPPAGTPPPSSQTPEDWDSFDPPQQPPPPGEAAAAQPPPPHAAGPIAPQPPPRVRPRRSRRGLGMMISGYSAFFAVWLVTAIAGAATFDSADSDFLDDADRDRQRAVGRRLMIPLGGPYAAAFVTDTATGALFSVLSGLAQTATLTLGITGTVIYARNQRAYRQVALGAAPIRGGSMMQLGVRF